METFIFFAFIGSGATLLAYLQILKINREIKESVYGKNAPRIEE